MEKFVLFELHEYMDMYPQKKVITFKGESMDEIISNATKWAKEMTMNYSGGPTRFIRVMGAEEAKKHIDEQIAYEHKHWQEDSQDWIDELNTLYDKCYPENLEEEYLKAWLIEVSEAMDDDYYAMIADEIFWEEMAEDLDADYWAEVWEDIKWMSHNC